MVEKKEKLFHKHHEVQLIGKVELGNPAPVRWDKGFKDNDDDDCEVGFLLV